MDFHHQKITTSMGLDDFLRVLYPQQDKYRIAAAWLIAESGKREDGLDGYELTKICAEKHISRATMQKTFVRLRNLGIIDRRNMRYYVNSEFSGAARRLSDAWRNMVREKKFSFDESVLRVNL
ncbi:MAG: hypothetical protein QXO69_02915 [archaeon]